MMKLVLIASKRELLETKGTIKHTRKNSKNTIKTITKNTKKNSKNTIETTTKNTRKN